MPRFPVNISGGTSRYKSRSLSNQRTINLRPWLIQDDPSVKYKYILENFAGKKLFSSDNDYGVSRGLVEYKGILYRIAGTNLYSVSSSGVHTLIGSVGGSNERCVFAKAVDGLVICNGAGQAYIYKPDVLSFSQISDNDIEAPVSCTFLNNQTIYDGDGGRFVVSDVGDSTSINGLNYATAESNVDDLVSVYAFNQRLYLFGEKTIETWWNSGSGSPPFDRIEGGIFQIGLASRDSLSSNDNGMYFLSDEKRVVFIGSSGFQYVSTDAIEQEISQYDDYASSVGFCMTLEGHNYYALTFPTSDKTFIFPEEGQWFEWSSGTSFGRDISNSYVSVYNKNIVDDYRNGNLYELDFNTYTNNGDAMLRVRDTAPFHSGIIGDAEGRDIVINRFELFMETRVGDLVGESHDPQISLQLSYDGGRTFGNEYRALIGNTNQDFIKVYWDNLGRAENVVFRILISDPVYVSIHSAFIDASVTL